MILTKLNSLYNRLIAEGKNLPEMGCSLQKFSFRLILDREGHFVRLEDGRELVEEKSRDKNGKEKIKYRLVPHTDLVPGEAKPPGSGLNPSFLWDNAAYWLGYQNPKKKATKPSSCEKLAETKRRYLTFESLLQNEAYSAFCRFLESWDAGMLPNELLETEGVLDSNGMVEVLGIGLLHQQYELISWWKSSGAELWKAGCLDLPEAKKKAANDEMAMCLITGKRAPVALLHEPAIKGVVGAQTSGAKLVSFNCSAFESYGKTQSTNAPVSQQAAFAYCNALNYLLSDNATRQRLGDTTMVFWADAPEEQRAEMQAILGMSMDGVEDEEQTESPMGVFDLFANVADEDSRPEAQDTALLQRVRETVRSLAAGRVPKTLLDNAGETPFYILGLSPNAARLSVRFFYESGFGVLLRNLAAHGAALRMQRRGTKFRDPQCITPRMILRETARESKEIPPNYAGQLMRSILWNLPYPDSIAMAITRRFRADRNINYIRCAYLKAWLTRKNRNLNLTTMLDTENKEIGYLLGRLFAALQKTQDDALGNINRTLRDSFYASASVNPAGVFPRLMKLYNHHLSKLPNAGQRVVRDRLVQEIMSGITSFPAKLTLEQQGLFAIGFYHQTQNFYASKNNNESSTNL